MPPEPLTQNPAERAAGSVLLLDIGNTNLKWAWLRADTVSPVESASHRVEGLAAVAERAWQTCAAPARVLVSNVAGPEIADALRAWTGHWGVQPEFLQALAQQQGVTNGYENPVQLGVDRWLALIGAYGQRPQATCVVDCGTAITVDVMDASGRHWGGLILPGFAMMRTALLAQTQIAQIDTSESADLFGTDTASAVAGASLHAAAALVERVLADVFRRVGEEPRLVLTGSGASRLSQALNVSYDFEPDLVVQGLARVAQNTICL